MRDPSEGEISRGGRDKSTGSSRRGGSPRVADGRRTKGDPLDRNSCESLELQAEGTSEQRGLARVSAVRVVSEHEWRKRLRTRQLYT